MTNQREFNLLKYTTVSIFEIILTISQYFFLDHFTINFTSSKFQARFLSVPVCQNVSSHFIFELFWIELTDNVPLFAYDIILNINQFLFHFDAISWVLMETDVWKTNRKKSGQIAPNKSFRVNDSEIKWPTRSVYLFISLFFIHSIWYCVVWSLRNPNRIYEVCIRWSRTGLMCILLIMRKERCVDFTWALNRFV